MAGIERIRARQILDSRGNPTIETEVFLYDGSVGRASVPSGASKGKYEALELRDNDTSWYNGLGVSKGVELINTVINDELRNKELVDIGDIDRALIKLDGTPNKSKLGANSILSVSIACCKAAAKSKGVPLYRFIGGVHANKHCIPMANIINGGRHAGNNLDFQEFMIIPVGANGIKEALYMITQVYHKLMEVLTNKGLSTGVGDEGGFAPEINDAKEAFLLITQAVEQAGYRPLEDIAFAMDAAASELYSPDGGNYYFQGESRAKGKMLNEAMQPDTISTKITRTTKELIDYYEELINEFPIISIEDGLDQNDYEGWREMTKRLKDKVLLVGDDLFVTNSARLKEGIEAGLGNAILIKPNQIGTVSETLETIRLAKEHGYKTIISHRSGETLDTFIADLAVAVNAGLIKAGAPTRGERVAKYNRLLAIEEWY